MKGKHIFCGFVFVSFLLSLAKTGFGVEAISPKLSFEQKVCDLGQVGLGTKNTCQFKFTNNGRAPLKITNVKSTCGCAVAKLEKKEYAPGESGTIKVIYTAPRTACAC
ncbi:MAG: DUF1573 domain-containing protein [Planctomycetes bacterium]|nr:DUF1573 domain-containing protein [Planctomycetota bacterium]